MATGPRARFDDLRAGTSLLFPSVEQVLVAEHEDDVVPVLAAVEHSTADGAWAFGYVGYEASPGLDPSLRVAARRPDDPPLVWFGIAGPPSEAPALRVTGPPAPVVWTADWTPAEHARAVDRVRTYIAAGDTYQCNLTDRLRATLDDDLENRYADLACAQGGAHNAYLDLGRFVVASASPELFVEWTGDLLRTRPMKGTAARGKTPEEDAALARALVASPKELAENLMIVDLLRNDLGRVARTGTVDVPALHTLERYPTVWQLTSEVTARTRPEVGLVDVFRALFPCGSVTGAPKTRTMEIIRELETGSRGVYCGAIGVLAPPDAAFRARFSVAIRTVVADRRTGRAVYGVGGGITWDSDPAAEHAELAAKAAVLTVPQTTAGSTTGRAG